jgi:hypothetical protein
MYAVRPKRDRTKENMDAFPNSSGAISQVASGTVMKEIADAAIGPIEKANNLQRKTLDVSLIADKRVV